MGESCRAEGKSLPPSVLDVMGLWRSLGETMAATAQSIVAASADGTPGNNANANALLGLQNQAIASGQTPLNSYGNLVFKIGNDVSTAQAGQSAGSQVLSQLQNLQSDVSNVDLNEESANLIRFQTAYQASARVVSVINALLDTTINMVQ